jgi:hypothetical protein
MLVIDFRVFGKYINDFPKNFLKIPEVFHKNSQNFENIQVPSSHLEAGKASLLHEQS